MPVTFEQKERYRMDDLLAIMAILRGENGCPWDREQDHDTIRKNFLEETYEVLDAIDNRDLDGLKEELGDVLLQVVFHSRMEEEAGNFRFDDVCDGICKKLIHRHPHIFGDVVATDSGQVLRNWDAIKKEEKGQATAADTLYSVPKALPALMRAEKVQGRAAKAGFDYPDLDWAMGDFLSEVDELREAIKEGDKPHQQEELGDLLFSAVNLARFLKLDPEESLAKSCEKFMARFAMTEQLVKEEGKTFADYSIQELNKLWAQGKERLAGTPANS